MLEKAHYLLRPFCLRRLKEDVEKTLPPRVRSRALTPHCSSISTNITPLFIQLLLESATEVAPHCAWPMPYAPLSPVPPRRWRRASHAH